MELTTLTQKDTASCRISYIILRHYISNQPIENLAKAVDWWNRLRQSQSGIVGSPNNFRALNLRGDLEGDGIYG